MSQYNLFNYKQNPRLYDEYAQLYDNLTHRIESGESLSPTEEAYYQEWADTCLEPQPSSKLQQLYTQLQSQY